MQADAPNAAGPPPDQDPAGPGAQAAARATGAAPPGGRGLYQYLHAPTPPLEQCLDYFWSPAVPLDELPPIPSPPDEPYEILKRLGPSPFEGSSFPLVGFFASAYERVRRFARERTRP